MDKFISFCGWLVIAAILIAGIACVAIDVYDQSTLSERDYCLTRADSSMRNVPVKCMKYFTKVPYRNDMQEFNQY